RADCADDPRNDLIAEFQRIVENLKPPPCSWRTSPASRTTLDSTPSWPGFANSPTRLIGRRWNCPNLASRKGAVVSLACRQGVCYPHAAPAAGQPDGLDGHRRSACAS